jgi:hypothetical protein
MVNQLLQINHFWENCTIHQLLENNLTNLNTITNGALSRVTEEILNFSYSLFYYINTGDFESVNDRCGINFDLVSDQAIQQMLVALFAVGAYGRTVNLHARNWSKILQPSFSKLDQHKIPLLGLPEDDECLEDLLRYQLTSNPKDFIRYTNHEKKPKVSWHYNSEFAHYHWTPEDVMIASRHLRKLDRKFDVHDWLFDDGPTLLSSGEIRFFLTNQNRYLAHKKRFEARYGSINITGTL